MYIEFCRIASSAKDKNAGERHRILLRSRVRMPSALERSCNKQREDDNLARAGAGDSRRYFGAGKIVVEVCSASSLLVRLPAILDGTPQTMKIVRLFQIIWLQPYPYPYLFGFYFRRALRRTPTLSSSRLYSLWTAVEVVRLDLSFSPVKNWDFSRFNVA